MAVLKVVTEAVVVELVEQRAGQEETVAAEACHSPAVAQAEAPARLELTAEVLMLVVEAVVYSPALRQLPVALTVSADRLAALAVLLVTAAVQTMRVALAPLVVAAVDGARLVAALVLLVAAKPLRLTVKQLHGCLETQREFGEQYRDF